MIAQIIFTSISLVLLMDDTTVEYGMSCEEIIQIESNREDKDKLFYPGQLLVNDAGRVYGQRQSGIKFHYNCDSEPWSAAVAIPDLSRSDAMKILAETKKYFSSNGCQPSLDMHEPVSEHLKIVEAENKWRKLKRHPYVVWRTGDRERIISAIPISQNKEIMEVSLSIGAPKQYIYKKPSIPVIKCF